jgi:transposase
MINFEGKEIHLACGVTDMRKSFNGLTAIVAYSFEKEAMGKAIYVFCNRKRDQLKILEWDGDGFWLHIKRLEWEHFIWPVEKGEKTMTLTHEKLMHLLGEPGLKQRIKRKGVDAKGC